MGVRNERSIHNDLALYRLVIEPFPDLVEALAKHPIAGENGSQLKELTRLKDEGVRRRVIEALLADNEIGVEDAKIAAGVGAATPLATPVAHQKHYNAIEGAWSRLSLDQKRQFVPKLASMLTPDMKRALRDRLNEELGGDVPAKPVDARASETPPTSSMTRPWPRRTGPAPDRSPARSSMSMPRASGSSSPDPRPHLLKPRKQRHEDQSG